MSSPSAKPTTPSRSCSVKTYALAFPELAPEDSAGADPLLDAARRFHAQYYRLDRAVLTITGDFEPSVAKAKVDEWFADPAPGAPPPEDKPVPRQTSPRFMSLEDRDPDHAASRARLGGARCRQPRPCGASPGRRAAREQHRLVAARNAR